MSYYRRDLDWLLEGHRISRPDENIVFDFEVYCFSCFLSAMIWFTSVGVRIWCNHKVFHCVSKCVFWFATFAPVTFSITVNQFLFWKTFCFTSFSFVQSLNCSNCWKCPAGCTLMSLFFDRSYNVLISPIKYFIIHNFSFNNWFIFIFDLFFFVFVNLILVLYRFVFIFLIPHYIRIFIICPISHKIHL